MQRIKFTMKPLGLSKALLRQSHKQNAGNALKYRLTEYF